MSDPDKVACAVQPSLGDLDDETVSKVLQLADGRIHGVASSCTRLLHMARQLGNTHLRLTADDGLLLASLPPRRRFASVRKLTFTMTADSPMSLPATTAGLLAASKTWPGVQEVEMAARRARGLTVEGEPQLTAQEKWWNKLIRNTTPLEPLLTLPRFTSLTKLKLSVDILTGHAIAPLAALTGLTKLTLSADHSELGRVSNTPLTQLTALQQLQHLELVGVPAPDRELQPMDGAQAAAAAAAAVQQGLEEAAGLAAEGNLLQEGPWFPSSLKHLDVFCTPDPGVWVAAAAASCSELEKLEIDWDGEAEFDLRDHPSCILRDHGHRFPKLRSLCLTKLPGQPSLISWDEEEGEDVAFMVASSYGGEVMAAYVCKELHTDLVLVPQVTHLTNLTELRVSGWRMRLRDEDHWQRLGALRELRELTGIAAEVLPPGAMTWPHLTQLVGRPLWAGADWRPLLLACPALRWLWVKTDQQTTRQGAGAPPIRPAAANLQHTALQRLYVDHQKSKEPLLEDVAAAVNRLAAACPNLLALELKSGRSQGGLPDFTLLPKLRWLTLDVAGHSVSVYEQLPRVLAKLQQLQGLELGKSFNVIPMAIAIKLCTQHSVPLRVAWGRRYCTRSEGPYAVTMALVAGMNCRFLYDHESMWDEKQEWRLEIQQFDLPAEDQDAPTA